MDKELKALILLNALLDDTEESIIFVDQNGIIEMLSKSYARFLKVNRDQVIGKPVTEVIPNTRLHIVVKTGKQEIGSIQEINGTRMIADRIPIYYKNKIIGCYGRVVFHSLDEVKKMYSQVKSYEKQFNLYRDEFKKANIATYSLEEIISRSKIMDEIKDLTRKVANTSSTVLLLGESGTGKELFAHSIHKLSKRRNHPFIKVNCGNIPYELLESELFGYEEGSFTGAKKGGKIGKFKAADHGTIFLDEIGDLPIAMQVKLLRVLQEREIEPLGSTTNQKVDVRIIAATNRNLENMIKDNSFRADLYYRLNVMPIKVPPLRDRKEDIPLLAESILKHIAREQGIYCEGFTPEVMEYLRNYSFPGNVRELQNLVERALNFIENDEVLIGVKHLPKKIVGIQETNHPRDLKEIVDEAEKNGVINAILSCKGNRSKAARLLNVSRTTLYEKIDKYKLNTFLK